MFQRALHGGATYASLAYILTAILSWIVAVPVAHAQAEDTTSVSSRPTLHDEIVVTPDRRERRRSQVGSSVTVITAEEIDRRESATVADLLRTVPGVEVARGGGPGQVTSVFVRGGSSSQTLVLIDGVRVNSSTTGAFDFADLPSDLIERIEIVRGPQSTLWGSEAVAGVVSITTRRGGDGFRVDLLAEAGQDDQRRLRAVVAGGDDRLSYSVAVSDEETDGVSAASERRGNTEKDPALRTAVAASLGAALGESGRLDFHLRYTDAEVGVDGFDFLVGPVDDPDYLQSRESLSADLRYSGSFGRVEQSVLVGVADDDLRGDDPTDLFNNFAITSRVTQIAAQTDVRLVGASEIDDGEGIDDTLTLGLRYEDRQGSSAGFFDESTEIVSIFVQNAWSWRDRVHLTLGARHDDHDVFGGETTWRGSFSARAGRSTRLHGSVGSGFKAPTLNDLFFPGFSNPNLSPETSTAFDGGVEHTSLGGRLLVDATYFSIDFDDLIAFDFTTFLPQNIASARSRGLEFSAEYQVSAGFKLVASQTWNETEDLGSGLALARRPEQRSVVQIFFRPARRLDGHVAWVSSRDRIDSDGSPMDDLERLDLTLHYRVSERLEPYLRIENLFDADDEVIPGFTTPGARGALGLRLRF